MERTVPQQLDGQRLDVVATSLLGLSRAQVQKHIAAGAITLNNQSVDSKRAVKTRDLISYQLPPAEELPAPPQLEILYEDDDVIAINKPADLAVHLSETGRPQPTVAAFAAAHGVIDDAAQRPGIVHRLDKDTSGVMLIAKHPQAKTVLQRQFKDRTISKTYRALVRGRMGQPEAMIQLPIGRDRRVPVRRAVVPGGRQSLTYYQVIAEYPGASLLDVNLHTGRTHQIRVHLSHLGHPVIGDTLYSDSKRPSGLSRQFLHAYSLTFTRLDGKEHTVTAPLPPELQKYLATLANQV